MRSTALLLVAVTALLSVNTAIGQTSARTQPTPLQPGRFQLFQGEYRFVNLKGQEFQQRALFKIDTATGEVFICDSNQFDGKHRGKPGTMVQWRGCSPFEGEIVSELTSER